MTIRILMFATLVMAIACSFRAWNWGLLVFAAACFPLVACLSVRKFLSRCKSLRVLEIGASIVPIYLFSHGPYIGLLRAVYGNNATPAAVDAITQSIYAPLGLLLDGPRSTSADSPLLEQTRAFMGAYSMEWSWFGGDIGVFVRALCAAG